jgi:Ni/Co efflux regulator RcnB
MSRNSWLYVLCVAVLLSLGPKAFADHDHDGDHGQGHGHAYGHDKDKDKDNGKHDRDDDRDRGNDRHYYRDHDRELHQWYVGHRDHLPPGLAKRDELPPGLERQLIVRGTLPPGLRGYMRPCPVEVVQYLPPPPVGYMHTVIGGHIALVNRKTFFVLDVFHFEM